MLWMIISWIIIGWLGGAFWWLKAFGNLDGDWLAILVSGFIGPLSWVICMLIMQPWKWGNDPLFSPGVRWKYKWNKPFWIK